MEGDFMNIKREQYNDSFKAKVALDAIRGTITLSEISNKYKVHSTQIQKWKQQVLLCKIKRSCDERKGTRN